MHRGYEQLFDKSSSQLITFCCTPKFDSYHQFSDAGHIVKYACLGDYVKDNVPTLKHFMGGGLENQEYNVAPLAGLSNAMRVLQR